MGSSYESSALYCLLQIEGLALGQLTAPFRRKGSDSEEVACDAPSSVVDGYRETGPYSETRPKGAVSIPMLSGPHDALPASGTCVTHT